jgi:hypothetical protein
LDVLGEMVGVERVLVAFQSILTLKKGARALDFQSNEPPLMFIRRPLPYEVPLGKKILIKHWSLMAFTIGNVIALPLISYGVISSGSLEAFQAFWSKMCLTVLSGKYDASEPAPFPRFSFELQLNYEGLHFLLNCIYLSNK